MGDDATKTAGRLKTERSLQDAALEQLRREGVLAGLNLSDVADDAGVNRGLVYHYFGSRRDLLRSALRRDARSRLAAVIAGSELPLRLRMKRFIDTVLSHRDAVALTTLLLLDGDDQLRVMPLRAETRSHLRRDASQGLLDDDLDFDAVHAAMVSLVWGYVLYRDAFAREFGISAKRLDERVGEVLDRMLTGLAPKAAHSADG
ncbi:MAG: hypothetical protein NVS3B21_32940 [Acidimicrobiales bacterium]